MKRYFTLLIALCLTLTGSTSWAESINEKQSLRIAQSFMTSNQMPSGNLRMAHKAMTRSIASSGDIETAYYVYNATGGGYVIVAGDDRAPAVLGYSDKGTFDPQDMPEAMKDLLEGYKAQMAALDQGAQAAAHVSIGPAIEPLVSAVWSQRSPYNYLLPFVEGNRAVVGCVATAMAQVMHYWKWPIRTTCPIPAYTTKDYSIYMPQLPVVNFAWDLMHETYETSDTLSESSQAVARLALYCAQSVNMNFQKGTSSATTSEIIHALADYYSYSPYAQYLSRAVYTTHEWEEMIYNELAESRPVIYRGRKASGGHAFICDGYAGNGMFHINWGWNGQSNGYFLLNILNPDAQGTGSASGSYGYIYDQGMIIGIKPGTGIENELRVTTKYLEVQDFTSTRTSTDNSFSVTQYTHFLNTSGYPISFDFGWALYREDNSLVNILTTGSKQNLPSQYYIYPTRTMYFGAGLTSGKYRIKPIFSEPGENNWRPGIGADINYIEVTINGNQCSIIGHGSANTPEYEVNDIQTSGHMHPNRPVNITLNVTNVGNTRNDLIYMFADGSLFSTGFVDLDKGESGDVNFMFSSEAIGGHNLTFSIDEDGNYPIISHIVSIEPMPQANLTGSVHVLNVTDEAGRIITDDKFSIQLTVSSSSLAYDEDITVKLYKHTYGNYGTLVQTKHVPLTLARRSSTTLQFDLENVMDGWKYFIKTFYFSEGAELSLAGSGTYTIVFPTNPVIKGDVNNDGEVNIADVNAIIDILLSGNADVSTKPSADVNGDGEINISDVNAVIGILLGDNSH